MLRRVAVSDLRAVLAAIGEKPPYVLVGASFGALYVRLYQLEHPEDVVGLVLIDPATEDRLFTLFEGDRRLIASQGPSITADVVRASAEANRAMLARLLDSRTANAAPMRKTPTVVLTRGIDMTPGIAENHAGVAALSTSSRHTVVAGAGHEIHLFAPSVVVQAIRDVSVAARQGTQLPARP